MVRFLDETERRVFRPSMYFSEVGERMIVAEGIGGERSYNHLFKGKSIGYTLGKPANPIPLKGEITFEQAFGECLTLPTNNAGFNPRLNRYNGIIVGGCGRSGTTLLLSILGAHPNFIAIEEELHCYSHHVIEGKLNFHLHPYSDDLKGPNDMWFVEKTPKNVRRFLDIRSHHPKWKLIHMVRDGRDVVTSKHPTKTDEYWVPFERWVEDTTIGLDSGVYIIKYEDLVRHPERTLRRLFVYLDLPWSDDVLHHNKYTNVKANIAWENGVQPITTARFGKWKKPEHRDRIVEFNCNSEAIGLMKRLGYIK